MALQRTRRPRRRSGRSLRSLGSPLNARPLGALASFGLAAALAVIPIGLKAENPEEAIRAFEAAHPGVEKVGGSVRAPKLVRHVNPEFPEVPRMDLRRGAIMLVAVVSETGNVIDPTVVMSAHPSLDARVLAAVQKWKYSPARKKGKPVKSFLTITVTLESRA